MQEFIKRDLTALSRQRQLHPIVGRDGLIRDVSALITQPGKSSVILTGEPGVGKTSVVEGVAQWLAHSTESPPWRILELDCNALVAGTVYRGQFEERAQQLLTELTKDGRALAFIDEVHTILGLGGSSESPSPFANMIKPYLANGEIRLLAATTNSEFESFAKKDPALARRFVRIDVPEPSVEETIAIVRKVAAKRCIEAGVQLDEDCAQAIVDISSRVNSQQRFPDRALDLLVQCIADKQVERAKVNSTAERAADLTLLLGIPEKQAQALENHKWDLCLELSKQWTTARQTESSLRIRIADVKRLAAKRFGTVDVDDQESIKRILTLQHRIRESVVGQERAVAAVCDALKRMLALGRSRRPIGSFLFLGPTGVGKTELAKVVAGELWGPERLMQFNMSEFMDREAVSKLIGAPPGYAGYDEGGRLVRAVRNQPRSIILFDEIEKAHPDVHNLLLQVLEEGQLQDGTGKLCSFSDCLVILTSNAGAEEICAIPPDRFTFEPEKVEREMVHFLKTCFRPEILNRLDRVILFQPLNRPDLQKVLELLVEKENRRLRDQQTAVFEVSDTAKAWIIAQGYDPAFGARPLRRVLQDSVLNLIADYLLRCRAEGESLSGTSLLVDLGATGLQVRAQ